MAEVTYRRAELTDLGPLMEFEARYMQEIEPENYSKWLAHEDKQLDALKNNMEHMFIAEAGGMPVGHCFWGFCATKPTIVGIYVMPEWRRKGVARALLACVEEDIAQCEGTFIELHTRVHNPAQHMFVAYGFGLVDEEKEWLVYQKPVSA